MSSYKRRREQQAAPPSDDDDLDEEDRLAMAAFENEGFDADLAEQEVKRQRENEEERQKRRGLLRSKGKDVAAVLAGRRPGVVKVVRVGAALAPWPLVAFGAVSDLAEAGGRVARLVAHVH